MARRLALLIAYGPEARAFLQSGLASRLAEEWEVALVAAEPASAALAMRHEEVLPMPREGESRPMRRIRGWSRGVRRRAPALSGLSVSMERCAGRVWGGGSWGRLLEENAIDALVAASAAGPRTLPALQAAANLRIPAAALLNSWRDLGARDALPAPLAGLGTTEALGSLHQAAVRQAAPMERASFCEALGLDRTRPIVLYATAANDVAEHSRLAWLADRLGAMEERPQLLIRSNPMDDAPEGYAWLARRPDVALLRPRWEWDREREWNCPLPEDLPWWRAALEHSALAVSLPSTVALDLAAWGKPAVNLAWGRGATPWAAESYAPIRGIAGVYGATSPESARARIAILLREPPALPVLCDDPVGAALRLLRAAFPAEPRRGVERWASARSVTP